MPPKKTLQENKQAAQKAKAAAQKAKSAAKALRQGKKIKKHRVHSQIRFHRRTPLALARKPKYARSLFPKVRGLDVHNVLKHPLITEKDMKKMEDESTMVFIVDSKATKPQIKRAFEKIYSTVKVRHVNTLNSFAGKKKAYIRLTADSDALGLANKIGII